jgi:acetamidase/formamidase
LDEVRVEVIKNLSLDGPILLPLKADLPPLTKPWRKDEWNQVTSMAKQYGVEAEPVASV